MTTSRRCFLASAGALALAAAVAPRALLGSPAGRARLALRVDLTACRQRPGCTLCREACHEVHNVPSLPDPTREVRWIWKETHARTFPDQVWPGMAPEARDAPLPVLCNHCDDPPCVRVCPTGATFARPDGIVAIDAHRCIGCRYCMAACPYGARSFNFQDPRPHLARVNPDYPTRTRGVVEKCTLCVERLATGRAPACVEVCPAAALTCGETTDPTFAAALSARHVLRRRPELGTSPHVFYLL